MTNKILSLEDKKKVGYEILKYVSGFCEEHGIRYYLAYGTLLGAVRHKGFIPWDDDVDLFIPRPDYMRLLETFVGSHEYKLLSCFNKKDYVYPFSKVQSIYTKTLLPSGKVLDHGLGIDLFPLDGIPDELDLTTAEEIFKKENDVFINYVQKYDAYKFLNITSLKNRIKVFLYKASVMTGALNRKGQKLSTNPYDSEYDDCSTVACVVGMHDGVFTPFKKDWFTPRKLKFEDAYFDAPACYDEMLSLLYPNYMQLPPESERITTHIADFVWSF